MHNQETGASKGDLKELDKVCEIRHQQNDKEHDAMKNLIKTIHASDARFLEREVLGITKELSKVEKLEERVRILEVSRAYIIGGAAVISAVVPLLLKFFFGI